jgi:cytochrome c
MRTRTRTLFFSGAAALAAVLATGAALGGPDEDSEDAEAKKAAQDALDKAVARGKELFHGNTLGKKTCASCHENAEKPNLNLPAMNLDYPRYSRKAKGVISMGQKINEMITSKTGGGKAFDLASADLVALEAYVVSLRKK